MYMFSVLTTIALQSYLRSKAEGRYFPPDSIDQEHFNEIMNEGS